MNHVDKSLFLLIVLSLLLITGCTDPAEKKLRHYQKGMDYVAAQKDKEAIVEFRNAIQLDQKYAEARYQLGITYLKTGQPGEAFKELERAISLDPSNIDALMKMAELYFLGKNYKESRAKVLMLLDKERDFPDAYALLAQIELAEGHLAASDKAIMQALQLKSDLSRYHIIHARILSALEKVDEAEEALNKAVQLDPDPQNFKVLINFYVSQKREPEAKQILQELQAKNAEAPEPYVDLAKFYMMTGDMAAAEQNILQAIDKKNDYAELYLMLGNFYHKTRDFDKAEKAYKEAISNSPKPIDLKVVLANFYYETGADDLAGQEVDAILVDNAQHSMANLVKAKLLVRALKNNEALVIIDRLVKDNPRWAELFYWKGLIHLNKGETELSYNAVDQALKLAPDNPDVRTLSAHHLFVKGDFESARNEALLALQAMPNNFRAANILGKSLVSLGKTDEAVKLFSDMEVSAPENIEILFNKAGALLAQKDILKSTETLEKILTLQPDFSPALVALSGILIQQQETDKAILLVKKHLQSSPENLDYYLLLAGIMDKYGAAPDEALMLLRQAQAIAPDSPRTYGMTAALLVRMGKKEEAVQEYKILIEKNPAAIQGYMALGTLLQQSGDDAGAKAAYIKALDINPQFAAAANNLAWLIANNPEPDLGEALRLALMAKEAFPEDPYIADTLGWIHYQRSSHKLALTQFSMATEKLPEMAVLRYHLALALVADGQKDQAKIELARCLAMKNDFPEYPEAEKLLKELR